MKALPILLFAILAFVAERASADSCDLNADLVVIIDVSTKSLGKTTIFNDPISKLKDFLKDLKSAISSKTNLAIINYGATASSVLGLTSNQVNIAAAINSYSAAVDTSDSVAFAGLALAIAEFQSTRARPDAMKIAVLISAVDGGTAAIIQAKSLVALPAQLLAVNVGGKSSAVTWNNKLSSLTMSVKNYESVALGQLVSETQDLVCVVPNWCASSPCGDHGTCVTTAGGASYSCTCDGDYMLPDCKQRDMCAAAPCLNGGVCSNAGKNDYLCSCPSGQSGRNCQTMVACTSSTCKNGGTCAVSGGSFSCVCAAGFEGTFCDGLASCKTPPEITNSIGMAECYNVQSGGTCHVACADGYIPVVSPVANPVIVTCTQGSWSPAACQKDPCATAPCLNGGVCIRDGDRFDCECHTDYQGAVCEVPKGCTSPPAVSHGNADALASCVGANGTVCSLADKCAEGFVPTPASITCLFGTWQFGGCSPPPVDAVWSAPAACTASECPLDAFLCGVQPTCTTQPVCTPAQYGGLSCEQVTKPLAKTFDCGSPSPCPVDGGWSTWSECETCPEESDCTKYPTCTVTRTCTNPAPQFGGADCVTDEDGSREARIVVCGAKIPCPVDGGWTDFAPCDPECPTPPCGSTPMCAQYRSCTNPPPANGGADCEGSNKQIVVCGEPSPCPVNGGYGPWVLVSRYFEFCGPGVPMRCDYTRECNNPPPSVDPPGLTCEEAFAFSTDSRACDDDPPCPIDGGWSPWTNETVPPVGCGVVPNHTLTRTCTNPIPSHGGKDCVGDGVKTESGTAVAWFCPVNGGWSHSDDENWPGWDTNVLFVPCGVQPMCEGERSCNNPVPAYGGAPCVGNITKLYACGTPRVCPGWSDWVIDTTKSIRTPCGALPSCPYVRTCTAPPAQEGFAERDQCMCSYGNGCFDTWDPDTGDYLYQRETQRRTCSNSTITPCPIDASWSEPVDCSSAQCPQTPACGTPPSTCNGVATCTPAQFGGRDCDTVALEDGYITSATYPCPLAPPCPVDGFWSTWSGCTGGCPSSSTPCGTATNCTQTRVWTPAVNGGSNAAASQSSARSVQCAAAVPCPINGGWSSWVETSRTSVSCGRVPQCTYSRKCDSPAPAYGGLVCVGDTSKTDDCVTDNYVVPCPINGGWGPWSDCGPCSSVGCDVQPTCTRSRLCNNPAPQYQGSQCVGVNVIQDTCGTVTPCCPCKNGGTCGTTNGVVTCTCPRGWAGPTCAGEIVDGQWTVWSPSFDSDDLTQCPQEPCGQTLSITQTRTCTNPAPQFGGADCVGAASQVQKCPFYACPGVPVIKFSPANPEVGRELLVDFTNGWNSQVGGIPDDLKASVRVVWPDQSCSATSACTHWTPVVTDLKAMNTRITITWNFPMRLYSDAVTRTIPTLTKKNDAVLTQVPFAMTFDGNTMTLTPATPLETSSYELHFWSFAVETDNDQCPSPNQDVNLVFSPLIDPCFGKTVPVLVSSSPTYGETDILLSLSTITLTFDQPVRLDADAQGSVTIADADTPAQQNAVLVQEGGGNKIIISIIPGSDFLRPSSTYVLQMDAGFISVASACTTIKSGPISISFSTGQCSQRTDVVFVLKNCVPDAVALENLRSFVSRTASSFTLGSTDTRVGLVTYDGVAATQVLDLSQGSTLTMVMNKASGISQCNKGVVAGCGGQTTGNVCGAGGCACATEASCEALCQCDWSGSRCGAAGMFKADSLTSALVLARNQLDHFPRSATKVVIVVDVVGGTVNASYVALDISLRGAQVYKVAVGGGDANALASLTTNPALSIPVGSFSALATLKLPALCKQLITYNSFCFTSPTPVATGVTSPGAGAVLTVTTSLDVAVEFDNDIRLVDKTLIKLIDSDLGVEVPSDISISSDLTDTVMIEPIAALAAGTNYQVVVRAGAVEVDNVCPDKTSLKDFSFTFRTAACKGVADIVFVVDASSPTTDAEFALIRTYITTVIGTLNVTSAGIRIGMVRYSDSDKALAFFGSSFTSNMTEAKRVVTDPKILVNIGGASDLAPGLDLARVMLVNYGRSATKKIVVVIGHSAVQYNASKPTNNGQTATASALSAAKRLETEACAEIFVVGVGAAGNTLGQFATLDTASHTMLFSSYATMNNKFGAVCAASKSSTACTPVAPYPCTQANCTDDPGRNGNGTGTGSTSVCVANYNVVKKVCVPCLAGSTNAAGDLASGNDTSCDPIICSVNQRVVNHTCVACPAGGTSAAGASAVGNDTTCTVLPCGTNSRVVQNTCVACPPRCLNEPGDIPSGIDTSCYPAIPTVIPPIAVSGVTTTNPQVTPLVTALPSFKCHGGSRFSEFNPSAANQTIAAPCGTDSAGKPIYTQIRDYMTTKLIDSACHPDWVAIKNMDHAKMYFNFTGGEANLFPSPGDKMGPNGMYVWSMINREFQVADVEGCFVRFFTATVCSNQPQNARGLFVHDDEFWLYVDGKLIYQEVGWNWNPAEIPVPIPLEAGCNHLVFKIHNGGGPGRFGFAIGPVDCGAKLGFSAFPPLNPQVHAFSTANVSEPASGEGFTDLLATGGNAFSLSYDASNDVLTSSLGQAVATFPNFMAGCGGPATCALNAVRMTVKLTGHDGVSVGVNVTNTALKLGGITALLGTSMVETSNPAIASVNTKSVTIMWRIPYYNLAAINWELTGNLTLINKAGFKSCGNCTAVEFCVGYAADGPAPVPVPVPAPAPVPVPAPVAAPRRFNALADTSPTPMTFSLATCTGGAIVRKYDGQTVVQSDTRPIPITGTPAQFYRYNGKYGGSQTVSADFASGPLGGKNTVVVFRMIDAAGKTYFGLSTNKGNAGGISGSMQAVFRTTPTYRGPMPSILVQDDPCDFSKRPSSWSSRPDGATGVFGNVAWNWDKKRTDGIVFGPVDGMCISVDLSYPAAYDIALADYSASRGITQTTYKAVGGSSSVAATINLCSCNSTVPVNPDPPASGVGYWTSKQDPATGAGSCEDSVRTKTATGDNLAVICCADVSITASGASKMSCSQLAALSNKNNNAPEWIARTVGGVRASNCGGGALNRLKNSADGTCFTTSSYANAKSICEAGGARLCSLAEIQAGAVATGTVCDATRRVWSSTSCNPVDPTPPDSGCQLYGYIDGGVQDGSIAYSLMNPIPLNANPLDVRTSLEDFWRYGNPIDVSANYPYPYINEKNTVSIFKITWNDAIYLSIVSNKAMAGGDSHSFTFDVLGAAGTAGQILVMDDPGENKMTWTKPSKNIPSNLIGRFAFDHVNVRTDGVIFGPITGCLTINITYQGHFYLRMVSWDNQGTKATPSVYYHPTSLAGSGYKVNAVVDLCKCLRDDEIDNADDSVPAVYTKYCGQPAGVVDRCAGGSQWGGLGDSFCRCPPGLQCMTADVGSECRVSAREDIPVTLDIDSPGKVSLVAAKELDVKICLTKANGETTSLPSIHVGPRLTYCNERLRLAGDSCQSPTTPFSTGQVGDFCLCPGNYTCSAPALQIPTCKKATRVALAGKPILLTLSNNNLLVVDLNTDCAKAVASFSPSVTVANVDCRPAAVSRRRAAATLEDNTLVVSVVFVDIDDATAKEVISRINAAISSGQLPTDVVIDSNMAGHFVFMVDPYGAISIQPGAPQSNNDDDESSSPAKDTTPLIVGLSILGVFVLVICPCLIVAYMLIKFCARRQSLELDSPTPEGLRVKRMSTLSTYFQPHNRAVKLNSPRTSLEQYEAKGQVPEAELVQV